MVFRLAGHFNFSGPSDPNALPFRSRQTYGCINLNASTEAGREQFAGSVQSSLHRDEPGTSPMVAGVNRFGCRCTTHSRHGASLGLSIFQLTHYPIECWGEVFR